MYSGSGPFLALYTVSRMGYFMRALTGSQCNDFNIGIMLSLYGVLEMILAAQFLLFVTFTKACQICQRKKHYNSPVWLLPVLVPTFL